MGNINPTIDTNFNITATKGDSFDKTIPITKNSASFNWTSEGYVSGICKVKATPTQTAADLTLTVDISSTGALRIYSASALTLAVGLYYYDIEFTLTGSKKKTWFRGCTFTVEQDVT